MDNEYYTMMLRINKEDIKDFLCNFYDEEEVKQMKIEDQATECINGILQEHFSDFFVIDNETLIYGDV